MLFVSFSVYMFLFFISAGQCVSDNCLLFAETWLNVKVVDFWHKKFVFVNVNRYICDILFMISIVLRNRLRG